MISGGFPLLTGDPEPAFDETTTPVISHTRQRCASVTLVLALALASSGSLVVRASSNIDPGGDGSKYAYAENVGWINAQPLGPGGPGMLIEDFRVTGWMWAENAGWISLSCVNTASCAATDYGVVNDGFGRLSGFAWSENLGWINFAPQGEPVFVDVAGGILTGRAWSENAGWITFSAEAPVAYAVRTSWCFPAPGLPGRVESLTVSRAGTDIALAWAPASEASTYDVVRGDVGNLVASGSLSLATEDCAANDVTGTNVVVSSDSAAGKATWYLVRARNCIANGTFDETIGQGQQIPRDFPIGASGRACP